MKDCLAIILSGGRDNELYPLTVNRERAAVPFGGIYRIIDFPLSSCFHSGVRRIVVLTQFQSAYLEEHLRLGWSFLRRPLGEYVESLPPQQGMAGRWYRGSADAVYQNIDYLQREKPRDVLVIPADNIMRLDFRELIRFHRRREADVTLLAASPDADRQGRYHRVACDRQRRAVRFLPSGSGPRSGRTGLRPSMGIYLFRLDVLVREVIENHKSGEGGEIGRDIMPRIVDRRPVAVFSLKRAFPGSLWWPVRSVDDYFRANMTLLDSRNPSPFSPEWPVFTYRGQQPPARVFTGESGSIGSTILSPGCLIDGARVESSVLSPDVVVAPGASVESSILLRGVRVGEGARLRRVIADEEVEIPHGETVGFDPERDSKRFVISPAGITVVPRGYVFTRREGGRGW